MPSPSSKPVHHISTCLLKPSQPPPHPAADPVHLSPWDLAMLSAHGIQKGLLFSNLPPSLSVEHLVDRLKTSLSVALSHFYPLAGRLVTEHVGDGMHVAIDCNLGGGAEFIHATADNITVADVVAPSTDVPFFIQFFFPYNGAVNHDGHSLPLVAIQLTELVDGVFVACCFNHAIGDGTSFWHFFSAWAEISRSIKVGDAITLSRPPVHHRWFIDGEAPPIKLPFTDPDQFIERFSPPPLREKIFHFAAHSLSQLKARANQECNTNTISSFQALSSLVWRCITRLRRLPPDHPTSCRLAIENRARLRPPLSPNYFGNSIYVAIATTTTSELLSHGLGWAAEMVNKAVADHTDCAIRGLVRKYHEQPVVYKLSMFDGHSVMMGSSPRFDMYGCDFGWGKAVAVRSGTANKFDGKVTSYPGWEGGGSVDLEVCLVPEGMAALEADQEFMSAVSAPLL